ncbi:MAX gene-associated protein [Danio aesculapii]|uniref:MAX gene-associated protein n=1 Tax=Danio aesculapii TaxID=1142201 RepID=UPI0024BF1B83|nr:MAX gene-associated protein [Danio aesculapii]
MFEHPAAMEITAEGMLGNHDMVKCTNPVDSGALVSTESRPSRVIEATLENESVWSRFHSLGTEMLLTPQGRRMFPCCRFRLRGLDPDLQYFLLMDIAPLDDLRHRFNGEAWEPDGPGEAHLQSPVCFHPDSPAVGQHWMDSPVSFYTVKLTQDSCEREGVLLRPMHRYQPRLYVAPVSACLERAVPLKSPDVHMFTFPKTEFYAVTSYQNPQITRLKIDCNPFMLAFREDESSARLIQNKLKLALTPARTHTANHTASDEEQHLSSTHTSPDECVSSAAVRDSQMARSSQRSPSKAERRPLSRGQRVVLRRPRPMKRGKKARAKWWTRVKNVQSLLDHRRRVQSISTPTDVCMQPDLEDVEGVLFVSFTAKEALDVHVGNMRRSAGSPPPPPSISPSSHTQQLSVCVTDPLVSEADRISELELTLLQDLKEKRNRQILHPELQKVGVKLNLLEHTAPVDLHYLGVDLPAAVTHTPQEHTPSSSESGFVSRTGKTNDLTRIKGWMEKFSLRSTSSAANSSAFCSEMLDEYLESEGQQISERAEVFSSSDPSPVVYQLPVRSSSYVRTLDSVLQMRTSPSAAAAPQQPSRLVAKRMRVSPVRAPSRPTPQPRPVVYSAGVGRVRSRRGRKRRRPHISFNRDAVDGAQPSCTEKHTQLRTLEEQALTHGQTHTFISTERARVSLSALLTAQSVSVETPQWSTHRADEGVCVKLFCRLGCVCDSLSRESAGSTHCRRVQCMFSCSCFKHKILLIRSADDSQSVRSLQTLHPDPEGRPAPAARVTRLWERSPDEDDPEPLFTPKPAGALRPAPRLHIPSLVLQVPMEKDPVYLYLESMMTCARVREYNSNPPPQVHLLPAKKSSDEALSDASLLNPSKRPQSPDEPEPTKVLEIISDCNWESQRSRVLKELFQRVHAHTLPSVLSLDAYTVELLSEHLKKDGARSMITYKVCVSLSDKEKSAQKECVQKQRVQKGRVKVPALKSVPLLCGVMTAGHLKAQLRVPDLHCPIQVNGRTYAQAKLTLGRMGALHPANRLAAHVTGRIKSVIPSRTRTTAASRRSKYTVTRANQSTDVFKKPATQRLVIPRPPGGIRFPKARRVLSAERVVPASALPPGQQVVLQPVAGMSGVNMCQFNGQMIQLVPVSAAAPMQIQTSTTHSSGSAPQDPQSTLQLPANTALPFIIPRINSVPGRNGFTFASAAAPGVQNNLLNKTGTFSFRICPPSAESPSPAPSGAPQGSVSASTLILPGGYKLIKLINPGEKPAQNNPAEESAQNNPAEKPAQNNPAEESAQNNPAEKPTQNNPAEKPAQNNPAEESAQNNPAEKPAQNNPAEESAQNNPAEESAQNNPAEKPAQNNPAEESAQNNPAEKPAQNSSAEHAENSQSSVCVKVEPAEEEEDITTQSANKPLKTEPEHIQIPQLTNDGGTAKITVKIEDADADESVPQQQSRKKEEPVRFGGFSYEGLTNSAFSRLSLTVPSPPAEPGEPDGSVQKSLDWLWRGRADVHTNAEQFGKPQLNGTLMYSSDGCTTEDSMEQLSEGEVDIETFEETDLIINRLREKARRKIQSRLPPPRSRQPKVKPVKCAAPPVRLMSDLLLYRRTRRLNQPIREKRRELELLQSERTLRRTMCVREQSISTEELLHQARELITSLEDHSRFLIAEKRALLRQHSHYQTLICISQASVAAEQKTEEHPADTLQTHTTSAVNRTSRLPNVILRSFRTAHLLTAAD